MLPRKLPTFFKARRDAAIQARPGAAFLIPANRELIRNGDVTYSFRQDSNFYYLTGLEEADSFLVLTADKMVLFVHPRNPEREMWDGERYGVEGTVDVIGANAAYPLGELEARLPELLKGVDEVLYRVGAPHNEELDRKVLGALEKHRLSAGRSGRGLLKVSDPAEVLGEMRLYKSQDEIEMMRKACQLTARAHTQAMKEVRPGMSERDIEALIEFHFKKGGAQRLGYWSIVAGGANAACLHYRANNDTLRDGELLLIDAGGEYNYYSGDITRTFPVGKRFSETQAKVYDLVLKSQLEAIALAKPGATLPGIHQHVCEVLIDGFLSLGLLTGKPDEIFSSAAYKRFYPHNTSHWLGMDVHDSGLYQKNGEPRKVEPGMVFTIEPGFYVQPLDKEAPAAYRNIGIRIEDDILITPSGHEVLTRDVVKAREDIEKLRS